MCVCFYEASISPFRAPSWTRHFALQPDLVYLGGPGSTAKMRIWLEEAEGLMAVTVGTYSFYQSLPVCRLKNMTSI